MIKKTASASRESELQSQLGLVASEPLSLEKLRFDAENPRIFERLGDRATQPQIENLLLTGGNESSRTGTLVYRKRLYPI